VIDESWPYKEQLAADLEVVRDESIGDNQAAWVRLERFVFWAAFVTRKLYEAEKLSDELLAERLKVVRFARIAEDELQDHMNADKIDRFYALDRSESRTVDPLWIASQLIHSFVFMPEVNQEGGPPIGFLFNSDKSRHHSLFHIDWPEFERLVCVVSTDEVIRWSWNRLTGESVKSRGYPPGASPPTVGDVGGRTGCRQ
jgi:hypothetical protein